MKQEGLVTLDYLVVVDVECMAKQNLIKVNRWQGMAITLGYPTILYTIGKKLYDT